MSWTLKHCTDLRRNNFNLLRILAALAVIYGHAYHIVGARGGDFFLMNVGFKFIGGVAVDVFFVVSGFLIASSLERSSIGRYLWARCLRIYPALLVCVALTVLVLGPLVTNTNVRDYFFQAQVWNYLWRNASLWSTEYSLPGVFANLNDNAVNGSLWSLPLEFRLYLVLLGLSLLGLVSDVRRFNWFVIAIFVFGYFITPRHQIFQEYSNWVESSAFFMAGAFLWKNREHIILSFPLLALFLIAAAALHNTDKFYIGYFVCLTYLTFFVAYVPKLPHLGEVDLSYGVYLYGWPVAQCVHVLAPTWGVKANIWVAMLISLGCAWLSWHFIEKRALSLKGRVGVRRHTPVEA